MVDALTEARRVLVPGGQVIDMEVRPDESRVAIEVENQRLDMGPVDHTPSQLEDRRSAGEAVARVAAEGLLRTVGEIEFDLVYRFDSVEALANFLSEHWENYTLGPATLARARSAWEEAREPGHVIVSERAVFRSLITP